MVQENHMQVHFDAKSVNEGLARMVVTAFMTNMNPTLEQIADVKTAVSEAVTNAIIHGYEDETKQVELTCDQNGQQLVVTVKITESELKILNRHCSLFLLQNRNWNVPVWAFPLWRHLWIGLRYGQKKEKEHVWLCGNT